MVEEARRRAERIAATLGARARDDARRARATRTRSISTRARRRARRRGTATEVGTLAARARRANAGVAGLYLAVEATTTRDGAGTAASEYVARRLERFDRDVRGYDAEATAKSILEHDERARASERASDAGGRRRRRARRRRRTRAR